MIDEFSTCSIVPKSLLASLIQKAKLIIWDEMPMMHKHYFEIVDRTLKDIIKFVDKKNKNIPFGGKVVVFGGDFRQIVAVIPKGIQGQKLFMLLLILRSLEFL
jgi:ATP-dependent DNA helicase PIF1